MNESGVQGIVDSFDPDFRAEMTVRGADLSDPAALMAAADGLDPVARDLFDALRLGGGAGEAVPERFRKEIDADGDDLWRAGLLLPRVVPSAGATIDPRYYGGLCRLNPALAAAPIWTHLQQPGPERGHLPPTHVPADAIVVAAALERQPARLTQSGVVRKDDLRRVLSSLGDDGARWSLALAWAKEVGLVRAAGAFLYGYPESKPRLLTEPLVLMPDQGVAVAAGLLLRVAGEDWISTDELSSALQERCPLVLAPKTRPRTRWKKREAVWLQSAADLLHRLQLIDAVRGVDGVERFRRVHPMPERLGGFVLTPDREVVVDPRELPGPEYGRLCRVAPFLSGDMVHRHRLTLEGVTADLAQGYEGLLGWLAEWSRTGVPGNVEAGIREWQRAAARVRLYSGVTVLEDPTRGADRFVILEGPAPEDAREINYRGTPPARFEVLEGTLRVPYGEDALTVRVLAARAGMQVDPDRLGWRWDIAPDPTHAPDELLGALRHHHDGSLPGELEAAVLGAAGDLACETQSCTLLSLPAVAADALCRDRVAGPLLVRRLDACTCIVLSSDINKVRSRLEWLGYAVVEGARPERTDDPDTAPMGYARTESSAHGG